MKKTAHPFNFTKDGLFATPQSEYVLSVHALGVLKDYKTMATEEEKAAIEALEKASVSFFTADQFSPTLKNDVPEHLLEGLKKKDWRTNAWYGKYEASIKDSLCVVLPGNWVRNFSPDHYLPAAVTDNPSTWGWAAVEELAPHQKLLKKICATVGVSLNTSVFKKVANLTEAFSDNRIEKRTPSGVNDLGRSSGYAVYWPGRGYADFQWSGNTIEKAKLFGSQALAEKAMHHHRVKGVVVKVGVSLEQVCTPIPKGCEDLNEALAVLQSQRMSEALKAMEIDQLRARLAELEGSPQTAPLKRRM